MSLNGTPRFLTYHESTYLSVTPLALDVLSMPASEAYAERVLVVSCLLAGETGC